MATTLAMTLTICRMMDTLDAPLHHYIPVGRRRKGERGEPAVVVVPGSSTPGGGLPHALQKGGMHRSFEGVGSEFRKLDCE